MRITRPSAYPLIALVGLALALAPAPAAAVCVHTSNSTITASLCVGIDCPCSPSFGFDTLRLQENNLRIKFNDTSTSASFPNNDWQLTANDSSNGGANHFSIDDITNGRTPFRVEAGAPTFSLFVEDTGDIGINTGSPVVELHIVDGDSPTLRLEQDGSSGFTPQTWDIAGNEANFFVRDVTMGSKLPFKIKPGAPTNSVFIAASANVGLGTGAPVGALHIQRTAAAVLNTVRTTNNGNSTWVIESTQGTSDGNFVINWSNTIPRMNFTSTANSNNFEFGFDDGDLTLDGEIITNRCAAPSGCGPADFVFEPDYELMELEDLESFVRDNRHLPNIPSGDDMVRDGISLSAMQMRLLEKIEELTLYTIAQQEEISELRALVETLR